tara:strand:+ start:827 stop:1243 length:417 start_codon:yes stop_codon:yes gene_type:complete
MIKEEFEISDSELKLNKKLYPNLGKNSHVGNQGVAIAISYLKEKGATDIQIPKSGPDIEAVLEGKKIQYEIKATVDDKIAYSKLKVSSNQCYELLKSGMELMRICKVGQSKVSIYFLKFGEDFELVHEPRFRVKRIKK